MEYLNKATSYYLGEEFENLYKVFKEDFDISYNDLFFNLMIIGYKKNIKLKLDGKGREFKISYFSSNQKALLYTIALTDTQIGNNLDEFAKEDFGAKAKKLYEEYANGGARYFCKELDYKWNNKMLDKNYKEYDIDLFDLIRNLSKTEKVPF